MDQEKQYSATMDLDQLRPIETPNNVQNPKEYLESCINQIFPTQFAYEICKRLKTDEDRQRLKRLKKAIFSSEPPVAVLKRFGFNIINNFQEIKTKQNICYFKFRSNVVNKYVHNNLIQRPKGKVHWYDNIDLWPGMELVCKEHYKDKTCRLFINYVYKITKFGLKYFGIKDEQEGIEYSLPLSRLKHFRLPYANTCHSVQGLTIDEPITVFDCNTPYVDREFIGQQLQDQEI